MIIKKIIRMLESQIENLQLCETYIILDMTNSKLIPILKNNNNFKDDIFSTLNMYIDEINLQLRIYLIKNKVKKTAILKKLNDQIELFNNKTHQS